MQSNPSIVMASEETNTEISDSVKTHINHLLSELESSETQVRILLDF